MSMPSSFGLSRTQHRLCLADLRHPGSPMHNLVATFELRGSLDVPALRAALSSIASDHEVLRTTIERAGDELVQVPHDSFELELPEEDLANDSALSRRVQEEEDRPFTL